MMMKSGSSCNMCLDILNGSVCFPRWLSICKVTLSMRQYVKYLMLIVVVAQHTVCSAGMCVKMGSMSAYGTGLFAQDTAASVSDTLTLVLMRVTEYEEDLRALMNIAVEAGMLDTVRRDSVLMAAGLKTDCASVSEVQEPMTPELLRERAGFLFELRQEWYGRLRGEYLRQDALTDLVGAPEQMPASAFHPRYLPLDVVGDNLKWAASRPLEVSGILARDRRLILSRMINEGSMPQFLRDIREQNPAVYSVVAIIMGILGGGSGFLQGSTMEMLVPRPVVGGQPWFDDMIFLDPNFDPRVYYPSLPVPQYDPENPSQQFKAAIRDGNSHVVRSVPIRSAGNSGPAGPPPVQKSRYVIP